MITFIEINKINPHPDNPRKDLGDLTELAASIKANGILQNLTVVPQTSGYCPSCRLYNKGVGKCTEGHDDRELPPCSKWESRGTYTAVIGHRRLAAAKIAGLEEVPCVISDMDIKTQVATMLLENLQRNDLTVWEQAQGFQMLLNFGETVEDIAEQTGFSGSTIRRRVKLIELDKDKFRESVARGATLQDYAELDKIQDIKLRNIVLESIGTSNFQWKLKQAIDQEKQEKVKAAMIAELETFATRVDKPDGLISVQWLTYGTTTKVKRPPDTGEKKYFFTVGSYGIQLLKEATQADIQSAGPSAEEQRQLQERRQRLNEINKRAYELRNDFVRDYAGAKKHTRDIMAFALWTMIAGDLDYYALNKDVCDMLGIELPEDEEIEDFDEDEFMVRAISEAFEAAPERVLLVAAYCIVEDERASFHNWRGEYEGNVELATLYRCLERLDYKISEEEHQLMDGLHELYVREEGA